MLLAMKIIVVRFDPSIAQFNSRLLLVKIVSSPVFLSQSVLLDLVNKSFVRRR